MSGPARDGASEAKGATSSKARGPGAGPHAREGFSLLWPVALRWSDIDRYGHANNVAVLSWFDTAVNDWYIAEGHLAHAGPRFVVAETGCVFHREIVYSDRIAIGIRAARVGTSSVAYDLAAFANDEPLARAQGRYVHVRVSDETHRPVPLDQAMRASLEETRPGTEPRVGDAARVGDGGRA